jgi:hypothetical protein
MQTTVVPSSMQNSLLLPGSGVPGFTWLDFADVAMSIVQEDKAEPQVFAELHNSSGIGSSHPRSSEE